MKLFDFFRSEEWRLLWPFYLQQLVLSIFFLFGFFWIIYLQDIGLSFTKISILIAAYSITPLIFEVPTGAIADAYGRKFCVILSTLLTGFTILIIPLFKDFWILLIIFLLMGVIRTLSSGADEAWVVDLLRKNKKSKFIHEYFIKMRSLSSFGAIFAGLIGALLVKKYGLGITWTFTGIAMIVSSIILFYGKEQFVKKKVRIKKIFYITYLNSKKAISYSLKHKILLYMLLATFFISFGVSIGAIVWQPFLKDVGLEVYKIGYIFSVMNIVGIGAPFLSKPLLKSLHKEKIYLALVSLAGMLILLSVYFVISPIMAIFTICLYCFFGELGPPVYQTYFQRFTPSKIRATVGSFRAMISGGGTAIAMILAGVMADNLGSKMTLVYSAFFIIPAIIFYSKIKEK